MILLITGLMAQIQSIERLWTDIDIEKANAQEEEKSDKESIASSFWPPFSKSKSTNPEKVVPKLDHIGDMFGLNKFDNEKSDMKGYHLNQTPLSIISNLLSFFEIEPLYFRNFTLMSIIRVVDNFYGQHQKILSAPEKPHLIPPSIIDATDPKFQDIVLHMYAA